MNFEDLLEMINEKQIDIAKKVGISRQMLTELKAGRKNMSLETLSKFVNAYPNLPWLEYIKVISQ